jgi:hypothetical protein
MWSVVLWGLAIIVGIVVLYLIVMSLRTLFSHMSGVHPKDIEAVASAPSTVRVRDTFTLEVAIKNTGSTPRVISNVDITAGYLGNIGIVSIDPATTESPRGKPTLGIFVHCFAIPLDPGNTQVIRFHCVGTQAGIAAGEVTVYVDSNHFKYINLPLQTVVAQ